MKPTAKLMTAALATLIAGVSVAARADTVPSTPAAPAASTTQSATQARYPTQTAMLTTADEALTALTRAHAARLALFDDDIEGAKARVGEAVRDFNTAQKDLNDLTIGDTENPANAARYLPFDMAMSLSEDFVPTADNQQALTDATRQMQSGQTDQAVQTLRVADISVNVETALLPIDSTAAALEQAKTYLDEGKFREANLALKSIEDSVTVRSYGIDGIPQQGAS